ncbi:hypothetical protein [Salinisphaera sp. G21_0]|nr:hypothetical protein [Salinisphaera sp. G21_0]
MKIVWSCYGESAQTRRGSYTCEKHVVPYRQQPKAWGEQLPDAY